MKIIYIHGMNKQNFSSASLKQRWLSLLKHGLEQSHRQACFAYIKRHVRIPFYGDLLLRHHLHNVLNASTLIPQDWPHFPCVSHLNPNRCRHIFISIYLKLARFPN
ncbi:hypothetical protein HNO87_001222 [Acinetobacter schindleri]|nr:hypothetical protein [Acinetobacter schindleri]